MSDDVDAPQSAWLLTQVGTGLVALEASAVTEVGELGAVTRLPHVPPYVLGLTSLRGEPLPIVDLARFLGLQEPEAMGAATRLATVHKAPYRLGFTCRKIHGVVQVAAEDRHEVNLVRGGRLKEFSTAELRTPHGIAAILDLESLLDAARVRG